MAQDELCLDGEEWRDVVGFVGSYQVSSYGRLRSLDRVVPASRGGYATLKGQIIKPRTSRKGFHTAAFKRNQQTTLMPLDELVATTFGKDKPSEDAFIMHLDGDFGNDAFDNLEWANELRVAYADDDPDEWRDIAGSDGLYQVSRHGDVRSVGRMVVSDKIKMFVDGCNIVGDCINGRRRVSLVIDGNNERCHVDTLVANAYVENPNNLPIVVHLDGDISNNEASNLAWGEVEMVHVFDESAPEEWRDVVGYEGYYQISSQGRLRSLPIDIPTSNSKLRTRSMRIMKQNLNEYGYPEVLLHNDGHKRFRVHRLVAEAFIPNPNNLPVVDHIDARRNNNCVDNLRWVTQKENIQHAIELGNISFENLRVLSQTEEVRSAVLAAISKPVIRSDGKIYQSQIEAARDLGLKSGNSIRKVALGLQKECKGYTFEYI